MKKINVIDLFSGCGGLLEGFESTNKYHTLACVEWDKNPIINLKKRLHEKWKYNNIDEIIIHFDLQRHKELIKGYVDDNVYGSHSGLKTLVKGEKVDIIIGGPPCQAYSIAGRVRDENGMRDDYRNYLFESYVEIVKEFQPDFFIFENVPGILSSKPNGIPITEEISKAFDEIGYTLRSNLREAVFDTSEFGVPQKRKRVIIFAVRKKKFKERTMDIMTYFYEIAMPQKKEKVVTVEEAIYDLPKLYPVDDYKIGSHRYSHSFSPNEFNHIPRYHNERDIEVFRLLAKNIFEGTNKYNNADQLKKLYTRVTGRKSNVHKYHVLKADKPSNTIPAHLYKDGLRHIHPDYRQARSITVREAARLQTFDDDYIFETGRMSQYKMIGNAVPPKFSKKIAESIIEIYEKFNI